MPADRQEQRRGEESGGLSGAAGRGTDIRQAGRAGKTDAGTSWVVWRRGAVTGAQADDGGYDQDRDHGGALMAA